MPRWYSTKVISSATVNTRIFQVPRWDASVPSSPPWTMKPAFLSPTMVMKPPIPIPMASLRSNGIASMIRSRRPSTTSTTITAPSITKMPIIDAHVTRWAATSAAANALSPSPEASANGYLPNTPIRMVRIPPARAVTASTWSKASLVPCRSAVPDRIDGLTNTM